MIDLAPEPGVPHPFDVFARRLLQADWESTIGPMRFSASLTLSDLADAAFRAALNRLEATSRHRR